MACTKVRMNIPAPGVLLTRQASGITLRSPTRSRVKHFCQAKGTGITDTAEKKNYDASHVRELGPSEFI